MAIEDGEMDAFIRETLDSNRRIREKSFVPQIQQSIASRSPTFIAGKTLSRLPSVISAGGDFLGGGGSDFPFKVSTSTVDGVAKFTVSKGSIQNGTNGNAFAIPADFFTNSYNATAGYVVIEATVTEDLTIDDGTWSLSVQALANTDEVRFTTSSPVRQDAIRLLLAKITMADTAATVWQTQFTSVRSAHGFLNGTLVLGFEAAPTHQSVV
jgi:hypothetical protein